MRAHAGLVIKSFQVCSGELLLLLFPSTDGLLYEASHIEFNLLAFIFSCTIGQVHLLVYMCVCVCIYTHTLSILPSR